MGTYLTSKNLLSGNVINKPNNVDHVAWLVCLFVCLFVCCDVSAILSLCTNVITYLL